MTNTFRPAPADLTGYTPTESDVDSLRDWFDRYDTAASQAATTEMADLAVFPLNLVSDAAGGDAWTGQCDREEYEQNMGATIPAEADISFDSVRTPFFLSPSLAVVFSTATITIDGEAKTTNYADVIVKKDGQWGFQTMVQPGWASPEQAAS